MARGFRGFKWLKKSKTKKATKVSTSPNFVKVCDKATQVGPSQIVRRKCRFMSPPRHQVPKIPKAPRVAIPDTVMPAYPCSRELYTIYENAQGEREAEMQDSDDTCDIYLEDLTRATPVRPTKIRRIISRIRKIFA